MKTKDNQSIKLVADSALIHGSQILLVTYKDTNKYDHQKGWFIPDDLVKFDEHPEDAARRILKEQVGYDAADLKLSHIESFIGGDTSWHLIFHYYFVVGSKPEIVIEENIDKHEWFDFSSLPDTKEIAHHGWAKFIIEEIRKNIKA